MNNDFFVKKLFVLTGASSGIGYAVAELLAKNKAHLIIASRSAEKLEDKIQHLKKLGAAEVDTVSFDMQSEHASSAIIEKINNKKITGLLVNAGSPKSSKILNLTYQDYVEANQLILAGPAELVKNLIPHMEKNTSSIVAITSSAVKEPVKELNLSAIYRSAFTVLLKNLAYEVGPLGIRINTIAPGKILTNHLEKMMHAAAQKNNSSFEEEQNNWASCAALNRMGTPDEVAQTIVFLMSNAASFISGQTILVDGCSTKSYF